jgi:hypothetical protein
MNSVGYAFLCQSLRLSAFGPERPALVKPVTRVEPTDTFLAIPRHVVPGTDDPLEHMLFALKHEGTVTSSCFVRSASMTNGCTRSQTAAYILTE